MRLWEQFDQNEIYLVILNAIFYIVLFLLLRKRIFTRQVTLFSIVLGFTIGILFDFTIGGGLLDFYKVNDTNDYEVTDILYYLLFGPFGYFFFYSYEVFKIDKQKIILYVIAWTLVGVGAQWLFTELGIITLQKGYQLAFSFPVFLVIQTLTTIIYEILKSKESILRTTKSS